MNFKLIKNVLILSVLLSVTVLIGLNAQSVEAQLDTCKREYIALSWSYDALEQRFIDSTYAAKTKAEQAEKDSAKEVRKAKRKSLFRGFLWGVPMGIVGGIMMFVKP